MIFDAIYYINLASRPDRKALFEQRALEAGFDQIIRYPAVCLTDAEADAFSGLVKHAGDEKYARKLSNSISHYNVVREAREANYEAVLIFEDDAVFCDQFAEKLPLYLDDLKSQNWDIAYLGGSPEPDLHVKREKCTQASKFWWHNPGGVWGTHAYLIHNRFYDRLLGINPAVVYPWDMNLIHVHPATRRYLMSRELLVIQDDASMSDLVGEVVPRKDIFQYHYDQHIR
jgi:GR25 family glycosyltransferase involved in LPS biosynthesis